MQSIQRFFSDERGLESVEYAIIGALVAAVLVAAVVSLRGAIIAKFGRLTSDVASS